MTTTPSPASGASPVSEGPLSDGVLSTPGDQPVLEVSGLGVDFWVDGTWYPAAVDIDFTLHRGEVLAIVGESGSGKSTTAMSLLGLLPSNSRMDGSIRLGGRELIGARSGELREIRGRDVAVIFQEPMTALNPVYTVGFQIIETIRAHTLTSPADARARAVELLSMVGIPDPESRVDSYPHQLSGGQRQRAMIAQALALDPKLLIADEPTTALDVTVQAEILDLMRELRSRIDAAIILITHDMGVVADMADRIMVMKDSRIVETADADVLFTDPQHSYTKKLLQAVPHLGAHMASAEDAAVATSSSVATSTVGTTAALTLTDVVITYPTRGRLPDVVAVDGVSLSIARGEVLGLVGESGSGKSTIGRVVVGLMHAAGGSVVVDDLDITTASQRALRPLRSKVGIVFQDPGSSLNPRWPIGESIGEPLFLHSRVKGAELQTRVEGLLDDVQLSRSLRNRYPHELSGGQRQRVGIARALSLRPSLLVADEPTSALDVSVQATVLELFQELQRELGFACLFISHDLAVVEILAQRIAVMSRGKLVEVGSRDQILNRPADPYTRRLLAAVPVPDPVEQRRRREQRANVVERTTS